MDSSSPRFLNRETSWLEFNRRVLEQALDSRNPLLERVRFLEIFVSNLDEFFMKRVGGLKRQVLAQVPATGTEILSPRAQLAQIRRAVEPLVKRYADCLKTELRPALEAEKIRLVRWSGLTAAEKRWAQDFFHRSLFPVLTPLAVDPGHPFPFISNLSVSFGVLMRHPDREGEELFARIKVPPVFPTWIRLEGNEARDGTEIRYLSLYELIGQNLEALFPGMVLQDVMMFRVTRNADVERDEEDADDLLEMVTEELRERRFAQVVRLEHGPRPHPKILGVLKQELEISDEDVYELPFWMEYLALGEIGGAARPGLKFPPYAPAVPPAFADPEANVFEVIRNTDVLVHHPYESFSASVVRFIRSAVEDPKVLAIKMTLYRTGEDSPFIPLLIRAAEAGKQVACVVELKARFDEARNIFLAQALEKAGVHVVYGIVGLKTHCKLALVVRQETDGVRSYTHIGTGNYHVRTSLLYTDLGLFTAKPVFTEDVVYLFHYLTGRALHWNFRKLIVAPIDMKGSFLRMIQRETEVAAAGGQGRIVGKMNSLEEAETIEALYAASIQGVKIDLIVRGLCCLRPGVPGLSENIRVISVVGRYLEHSRLYYFGNGAEDPSKGEFFIGSADWMARNLGARVEAVVPVEDAALKSRLWEILTLLLADPREAWEMGPDGAYTRRAAAAGSEDLSAQTLLMKLTRDRGASLATPTP